MWLVRTSGSRSIMDSIGSIIIIIIFTRSYFGPNVWGQATSVIFLLIKFHISFLQSSPLVSFSDAPAEPQPLPYQTVPWQPPHKKSPHQFLWEMNLDLTWSRPRALNDGNKHKVNIRRWRIINLALLDWPSPDICDPRAPDPAASWCITVELITSMKNCLHPMFYHESCYHTKGCLNVSHNCSARQQSASVWQLNPLILPSLACLAWSVRYWSIIIDCAMQMRVRGFAQRSLYDAVRQISFEIWNIFICIAVGYHATGE